MATETDQQTSTDAGHEQMFANWVYQVPGFILILVGFGGLALLAVA